MGVVDVVFEELLLDDGLPDYVEFISFCQDGWGVEMTTDVFDKFLMTMLWEIAIMKVAQVQFDVVANKVERQELGQRRRGCRSEHSC